VKTDWVLCDIDGGVATITLNNPPLNVITLELTRALGETLAALAADESVRALVLTGAGEHAVFSRLDNFPKPRVSTKE